MIKEQLADLIKKAMIEKDKVRLETLRAIKTAFLNWETAKNAKPLDEAAEIQIIRKLVTQREESAEQFKNARRTELEEKERSEIKVLQEFLPAAISEEEIMNFTKTLIVPGIDKKEMGRLVKEVKAKFPTAEGKIIAAVVKNLLNA